MSGNQLGLFKYIFLKFIMYIRINPHSKIVKYNTTTSEPDIVLRTKNNIWALDKDHFKFFNYILTSKPLDLVAKQFGKLEIFKEFKKSKDINILKSYFRDAVIFSEIEASNLNKNSSRSSKIINTVKNFQIVPAHDVIWELTRKCNAKCKHCYQVINGFRPYAHIPFYTKDQIVKAIENLNTLGVSKIKFTGGEATLLGVDSLAFIFKECAKYNIFFSLNTNGLNDLSQLSKVLSKNPFFQNIQISLDGYGQVHDNFRGVPNMFNRIKQNLRKVSKTIPVHFVSMIHKEFINRDNLSQLISFVMKYGKYWLLELPVDLGNWKVNKQTSALKENSLNAGFMVKLIKMIIKENPHFPFSIARVYEPDLFREVNVNQLKTCGHHHNMLNISPAGISFCVPFEEQLPSELKQIAQPYDNLNKVLDAWNLIGKYRSKVNPVCKTCPYLKTCRLGCPGQYTKSKNFTGCDTHFRHMATIHLELKALLKEDKEYQKLIRGSYHMRFWK